MKNTVQTFKEAKKNHIKLAMLTAYDYSTAKLQDEAGINGILVGDSLGNVILGYEDTISVTMEDMIHHGAAVARGAKNALVVVDMPFMSYQTSVYDAVVNAGRLSAPVQALGSIRGLSRKKMPYVLGALLVCVPLLMVLFPLLTSADALFAQVTRRAADWFDEHLALWALRLIFGLLVAPFLFGLLYSLRRPEPLKRLTRPVEGLSMEAAGPVTVLAVLDVLYAFFLAVQCAALFGGADYLARAGISYASYARSGFFQLVAVAAVNLACLLACLALCKGEGRGLRMVQVLGTLLVAASGVLLVSALWRMNLYVGAYGLSFKRALTYWGMAVLAVLLAAALWKVWHRHFRWFRVLRLSPRK